MPRSAHHQSMQRGASASASGASTTPAPAANPWWRASTSATSRRSVAPSARRRHARALQRQAYQVTDLGPQVHLLAGEPGRLGGRGDLDVQPRVGAPAVGQGGRPAEPFGMLPEHGDVGGQRALGGQPGGGAGDRRPAAAVAPLARRGADAGPALPPARPTGGPDQTSTRPPA